MEYRFLGDTGVRVSELCLGTMPFGGAADERESKAIFDTARERGVNFFDTANVYNQGESERLLGRFIQPCRDEVVIATKAYFPIGEGPNQRGSSRYHLVRSVEDSLKRLNTDRIDVFYLHRFDERTGLQETMRATEHLVESGKVLYLAASNFAAWQVMKAQGICARKGWSPLVALQPMYNLAKRQAEVEILPMAESEGLGACPYSPLGGGLLTGKYGIDKRPPKGRLVDNEMYQTRYGEDAYYEIAQRFNDKSQALGIHPVSLAIAWVSSHPAVTAPIIGGRNVEQLEPAFDSVEVPMDEALREEISALSPRPAPATDRAEERTKTTYGSR